MKLRFLQKYFLMIIIVGSFVTCGQEVRLPVERYEANWLSLKSYKVPEWYKDAKLGIFIHWGPYCVPEYGSEWYPRLMYMDQQTIGYDGTIQSEEPSEIYTHHTKYWGDPRKFGYKDFIPLFTGENFDSDSWMQLFQKAGAKYVVAVAEHSDGFAMYKSSQTRWNAVEMGPKRDILKELSESSEDYGLKFGASTHYAFNWEYYQHKEGYDTMDPDYYDLYGEPNNSWDKPNEAFVAHWWNRTKDIIDHYPLDILWFDFYWKNSAFGDYHKEIPAYFYNSGLKNNKSVVLNCKNSMMEIFPEGTVVLDIERGKFSGIRENPWQTDTSIGKNSWGYVKNWDSKSANDLLDNLVDIVSKNGNLLLNVGPQKDGAIPANQVDMLLEIGNWLAINGEAIYGTRPWKVFGEGPTAKADGIIADGQINYSSEDLRFTTKDNKLYIILLSWPKEQKCYVKSLGEDSELVESEIASVKLIGHEENLDWRQLPDHLQINLPGRQPSPFAHAIKIEFR